MQEIISRLGAKAAIVRYHLRRLRQEGKIEPTTQRLKSPNVQYRLAQKQNR
jgi:DNA-binding transcriptional ArsR family regulator